MITNKGTAICDAEIGRPNWRACRRAAIVAIHGAYCELHYCPSHRDHATDKTGRYFKPRPFAEPREIARAEGR